MANTDTVRCALRVLFLATTMSILIQADPVPRVPPGCREHCSNYTKHGGRYSDCVPQCPPEEVCLKAIAMTDHTEVYTDHQPGLPERPKPCKNHCWRSTVYVMHSCMVDCPETWCRLYGGIVLSTTTPATTTTTQSITSTKSTTTLRANTGPKIQAVLDGSADSTENDIKQVQGAHNTNGATIGLSVGISLSVVAVCAIIVGSVIAYKRYHKKDVPVDRTVVQPATSDDQPVTRLMS